MTATYMVTNITTNYPKILINPNPKGKKIANFHIYIKFYYSNMINIINN